MTRLPLAHARLRTCSLHELMTCMYESARPNHSAACQLTHTCMAASTHLNDSPVHPAQLDHTYCSLSCSSYRRVLPLLTASPYRTAPLASRRARRIARQPGISPLSRTIEASLAYVHFPRRSKLHAKLKTKHVDTS